jgi:glutaredoxin 2
MTEKDIEELIKKIEADLDKIFQPEEVPPTFPEYRDPEDQDPVEKRERQPETEA